MCISDPQNQAQDQAQKLAQSIFEHYLPKTLTVKGASDCYAPSNIALSKYWGKRHKELNLPCNSSLSISLREWGSRTKITPSDDGKDHISLNGNEIALSDPFASKIIRFADKFRRNQHVPLVVETFNSIPTAAGLASSASGFAALTMALVEAFGLDLPKDTQSMMARMGSGSACRSLWHGFVQWDRGQREDGTDSVARPLDVEWQDFRIAIVPVDTGPKSQSSREGMNLTTRTSPLYDSWPEAAERDCETIRQAVLDKNFENLGATAEANALAMHATMMAARPSLVYLKPQSWAILEQVWQCREQGHAIFATMDAGANVKLLFLANEESTVRNQFADAKLITPFKPLDAPNEG